MLGDGFGGRRHPFKTSFTSRAAGLSKGVAGRLRALKKAGRKNLRSETKLKVPVGKFCVCVGRPI